jgi:hypothetical protein
VRRDHELRALGQQIDHAPHEGEQAVGGERGLGLVRGDGEEALGAQEEGRARPARLAHGAQGLVQRRV